MIQTIISISEFATKLVAGLSGVFFGALILGLVVAAKNKKTKNINPDELKRKAKNQPVEEEKSKKKTKKAKDDNVQDAQSKENDTQTDATEPKPSNDNKK